MKRETIAVLGAGRLGLVCAASFARLGHTVWCADRRPGRIEKVRTGDLAPDEPGLQELVQSMQRKGRLFFSSSIEDVAQRCDIIDVCLDIPNGPDGACDLDEYFSVLRVVGRTIRRYKLIMVRARVPVGTTELTHTIVHRSLDNPLVLFDVASHPTFVRPHRALHDWFHPERLIIGHESSYVQRRIRDLYRGLKTRHVLTDPSTADMMRHALHACQAARNAALEEIEALCDHLGVDAAQVRDALSQDSVPALPGGSHPDLTGDAAALAACARQAGIPAPMLDALASSAPLSAPLSPVPPPFGGTDHPVCLFGFQASETSAGRLRQLLASGHPVRLHVPDPGMESEHLDFRIERESNPFRAADGACALIVLDTVPPFSASDWRAIANLMLAPRLYDPDRLLADRDMPSLGFSLATHRTRAGARFVRTG